MSLVVVSIYVDGHFVYLFRLISTILLLILVFCVQDGLNWKMLAKTTTLN